MTPELWILFKGTTLLLLGLAMARLARRARASVRHAILACTFGTLLVLPIAAALAPQMIVKIPVARATRVVAPRIAEDATTRPDRTAPSGDRQAMPLGREAVASTISTLRLVWIIGAAVLLASLATALVRLARVRRRGIPWMAGQAMSDGLACELGIRRSIPVLLHDDVTTPVTCGLSRPVIMLPPDARDWTEADVRRAFVHELEHVRRGDWSIQLMARVVCAVYWFNPLVWVAWRQLCLDSERACDDVVLSGAEQADYAEQLVTLAQRLLRARSQPALSMASRSDLSARVSAVLDATQRRGRAGTAVVAVVIGAAIAVVALVAPVRAVAVQGDAQAGASAQPLHRIKVLKPAPWAALFVPDSDSDPARKTLNVGLVEAAQRGDLAGVTELLASGADVNASVSGDGSPLIVAAREGHMSIVGLLLDRGASVDLAVHGDGNPLIMAAREGHLEIVKVLLDRGASIDLIVPDDENALIQASGEGHLDVVKLLVTRGANVNARAWAGALREPARSEWRTPLSMARRNGHDAVAAYLVSAGAAE
jgi:beta-lactamase regulating signal transducer with metallopeptidase domain